MTPLDVFVIYVYFNPRSIPRQIRLPGSNPEPAKMLLATCFRDTKKASITAGLFHHHDSRMAVRMLFLLFALMEKVCTSNRKQY